MVQVGEETRTTFPFGGPYMDCMGHIWRYHTSHYILDIPRASKVLENNGTSLKAMLSMAFDPKAI